MTQGQLMLWVLGGLGGCIVLAAVVWVILTFRELSALVRKWRLQAIQTRNTGDAENVYDECAAELAEVLGRVRQVPMQDRA